MKRFITTCFVVGFVFVFGGCPASKTSKKKMPLLFQIASVVETGKEPSFLVSDDFDVDGKLDLVVLNSGDHSMSYFKGKGDGEFRDGILFKTGADPICIVVADFNSDGLKDLAELNYQDQNVYVFLNTGKGSFKHTGQILKPGRIPINLTAADFDQDGMVDLMVSLRFHKVAYLRGTGGGKFAAPVSMPVRGQPTGLVVGDYNKDAHPDLAVALAGSGNVGVQVLWGDGRGKFKPSPVYRGGGQPLTIANVDANGDGNIDLITSSNSLHALTIVMNNGDGTFKALRDFSAGEFPKFIAVSDFTGNGIPDLAISNATHDTISVMLGQGDGTFTYPPIRHFVEEYPQGIVAGDFNKDGLMDIAISCRDKNHLDIMLRKNFPASMNPAPKEQAAS